MQFWNARLFKKIGDGKWSQETKGDTGIMTKEEFLRLDYGNIVTSKRFPGETYEIDDLSQ